jgi:hypothetical protein
MSTEISPNLTAAEKGERLHSAVLSIEKHILNTSPDLTNKNFTIEEKKIVCIDGVHHEIDIYVTVNSAPGYSAIYIFECKNWKDAVGKNEVVEFIDKIVSANAQHGYFVARSFTKDAAAKANQCKRLTLLIATQNDTIAQIIPGLFHTIHAEPLQAELKFDGRNRTGESKPVTVDTATAQAKLGGSLIDFPAYVRKWIDETMHNDVSHFRSERLPIGRYEREAEALRIFQPEELTLDGTDTASAAIHIWYAVTIYRPVVSWSFDVETRGRVLSLTPIELPGGTSLMTRIAWRFPPSN